MKRVTTFFLLIFTTILSSTVVAGPSVSPQTAYIETYSVIAVSEMYRSGVPASITLAQGLLESGYGRSELAVKGNNHFGIKCHNDWTGARVYHDDDRKGECFRKYPTAEQSFRDHSDFLRYRDRYKFLFNLRTTDYKGWAYGLKQAGYATDPAYPAKLIRLIEDYKLYEYDTKPASYGRKTGHIGGESKTGHSGGLPRTGNEVHGIPESPSVMEQVLPLKGRKRNEFSFSLSREMYSQNGVPFVYSVEGETCADIARMYGLFLREILKYNDLDEDRKLLPGTVVYLQAKKKQAAKGVDKYVIDGDETMREIAQRYAIRLERLYKMNGIDSGYVPREGDILRLRK